MINNLQAKKTKAKKVEKKKNNSVYYNVKKEIHIVNVWKKKEIK